MVDIVGHFPATLAIDSNTGTRLRNAEAQVFAMADTSFTSPLAITDMADVPLTGNVLRSNSDGIYPEFKPPAGVTQVIVKSGQALTPMTSIAVAAEAAETAAAEATAAATLAGNAKTDAVQAKNDAVVARQAAEAVGATTDAQMTAIQANPASAFAVAQKATIGDVTSAVITARAVTVTSTLAAWFQALRTSPSTAKVALVGPSTVDIVAAGVSRHARWKFWMTPGGPLEGMADANLLNFGYNGQTGDQITSAAHMADLAAAKPSLICASGMLINSVRATTWTLPNLVAALIVYIERIRSACPGVPIILETGNPFLTTDVGGNGYVSPNAEAQAKTDLMRNAHLSVIGRWPDVLVRDVQTEVYGATSVASHPYMSDQIHPNSTGMDAEVDALMPLVGYVRPASQGQSVAARASAPYTPWAAYGREVEDVSRYLLLANGRIRNIAYGVSGGASDLVDFDFPGGQIANLKPYDIVELPGGITFQLPRTGTTISALSSTVTRLIVAAGVVPAAASALSTSRGYVKVWRQSRPVDQSVYDALVNGSYNYKKVGRVRNPTTAGAAAYLDIEAATVTSQIATELASSWSLANGDRLYVDGLGSTYFEVGASGVTAAANSTNQRLIGLPSADRSGLFGRLAVIVGNHA